MKLKRFLFFLLVFSLISTMTVFADSAFEWYKGTKVKIMINNNELSSQGLIINSKTMVPLSDIANTLQAIVKWDDTAQTVRVFKPNVHITLVEFIKEKPGNSFGIVKYKGQYDFKVIAQIDNLLTKISTIKVTIEDPYGKEVESQENEINQEEKDNFWFQTTPITHQFKYLGKYTVKFFMKTSQDSDYTLVSEKIIVSQM